MEPCIYLLQLSGPTSALNCTQAATLAAVQSSASERYLTDWPGPIYSVQKAAARRRLSEFGLAGPGPGAEWLCQVPGSLAQQWPDAARELSRRWCLCVPLLWMLLACSEVAFIFISLLHAALSYTHRVFPRFCEF